MAATDKPSQAWKRWMVALRAFSFTASVVPVFFGTALAIFAGATFQLLPFILALSCVACLHAAANLLNDVYDYRRGLDRFIYPASGAIVRGWITERQARHAAVVLIAAGLLGGIVLSRHAGRSVAVLGGAGILLALAYTRDGMCLKHAGFGDVAIFLAFGVLPVLGSWWVQTQRFSWMPVMWSAPLVGPTVAILHANNWRDRATDKARGYHTLAVRLTDAGCSRYYGVLLSYPFILVVAAVGLNMTGSFDIAAPPQILLTLLALPLALKLKRREASPASPRFVSLDAATAKFQFLFGALLTAGFLTAIMF